MLREISRRLLLEKLPETVYRIEMSEEDKAKLKALESFFLERPEMSFIVYMNHISYNDPLLVAYVMEKIDRAKPRHWLVPTSYSHTDKDNIRSKDFLTMVNGARKLGFDIVRVVQTYQIGDPEYGYTSELAMSTYKEWLRRMKGLKEQNVPIGMLISPEGHRSEDGSLAEFQNGIIAAGRILAPVVYIPLAISYPDEYDRNGLNLLKKVNLALGNVVIQEGRGDSPSLDDLIRNLVLELPEHMRGRWQQRAEKW